MRAEWRRLRRSRASEEGAAALLATRPKLRRHAIVDLGDVVDLLEPAGGLRPIERAQLVEALLEAAGEHPMIRRALLQTLLPGLVGVARKLQWGRGQAEEPGAFLADLITIAYELIEQWSGQTRPYAAPDILNAVRCRMRRAMIPTSEGRTLSLDGPGGEAWVPLHRDLDPTETIEALLADVRGEVDPVGAAALYGREVLGLSYRELAEITGISPRRLSSAGREVARRIFGGTGVSSADGHDAP